jgi:hypothetical protein
MAACFKAVKVGQYGKEDAIEQLEEIDPAATA